jgi:hypothetical protein
MPTPGARPYLSLPPLGDLGRMKITIYGWRIEELPLHPQLGDLAAQPARGLLAFAAGQPLKLTLVYADLLDPLAQRLAVEAELPGDLGVRNRVNSKETECQPLAKLSQRSHRRSA